jgi:ABC-type transport system involved in multi-copper enzyme maturation permease subunit
MSQALAVTRYTLIELGRRRLLFVIVAIGAVLMAGIAISPHVLPGLRTDNDRLIVILTALEGTVPYAVTLCAFAVGMTVINHDLDSGAVVSIFAKPCPRSSYTAGKLLAAVLLLLMIAAIFTVGSLLVVAATGGGGGVYQVVFWTCAALASNIVLLMLLVMVLTVYINNVIAAAIVLVFHYLAGNVLILHAMVQNNVITDAIGKALVNVVYWGVPHELTSNLQRQILELQIGTGVLRFRGTSPLDRAPVASGSADIAFWLAYVVAIALILFWSVRRKQV